MRVRFGLVVAAVPAGPAFAQAPSTAATTRLVAQIRLPMLAIAMTLLAGGATANPIRNDMLAAFAAHCFSPLLTAQTAQANIASTGARVDFYDLNPFSDVAPTPGANITPGTDRRCEVTFDGDAGQAAANIAVAGLQAEGIRTEAPLPDTHVDAALPGTTLLGARYLNPARIAVVHTGTRPGPNGPETFLSVERLTPEASRSTTEASTEVNR